MVAVTLPLCVGALAGNPLWPGRRLCRPDNLSYVTHTRVGLHLARGNAMLRVGRYAVAEEAFRAAGQIAQSREAFYGLGLALAGQERWSEASRTFASAVGQRYGGDSEARIALAYALHHEGQTDQAVGRLRGWVRRWPEASMRVALARLYLLRGQREEASVELALATTTSSFRWASPRVLAEIDTLREQFAIEPAVLPVPPDCHGDGAESDEVL